METTCPNCKQVVDLPEDLHYKITPCPRCGKEFQAFSESTQKLTRDFLDEVLKRNPKTGAK
jgi:uncharacterized paraquat-inducible protein A